MSIQPLEEWTRSFWGMTPEEVDAEYIQKPVGKLHLTVTRWKSLPTIAFRKLDAAYAESSGSAEQFEIRTYRHGPVVPLYVGDGRFARCQHEEGGSYVVDPDAPDRLERFRAVWTAPVTQDGDKAPTLDQMDAGK